MDKNTAMYVLRHGQSLEDIDKTAHERLADEDMPLSSKGVYQALDAGEILAKEIKTPLVCFYMSPSKRVEQTTELIASKLATGTNVDMKVLEVLRKQNWGNITPGDRSRIERSRYETGVLRYSFPNGESSGSFLGRLSDFVRMLRQENGAQNTTKVLITHGFEMRVILMLMLGWDEDYFESLAHPDNCEMKKVIVTSTLQFKLEDGMRTFDPSSNPSFIPRKKLK